MSSQRYSVKKELKPSLRFQLFKSTGLLYTTESEGRSERGGDWNHVRWDV